MKNPLKTESPKPNARSRAPSSTPVRKKPDRSAAAAKNVAPRKAAAKKLAPAKKKVAAGPKKVKAPRPARAPQLKDITVAALEDLKAQDIKVLEVAHLTTITDTMVICTGTSSRHVKSLADNVLQEVRKHGIRPMGVEGLGEGEWVLVNLNGVVVHVMQAQTRAHYQLEKLWGHGPIETRHVIG